MKTFSLVLFLIGVIWVGAFCIALILAGFDYERQIGSNWTLADKTSTLAAKSEYIDQFVSAFEKADLAGTHNALFLKTPNNSFDKNFGALKTLQGRLHEIQKIDPNSFAYQQAISQITAQEQGEAVNMISVLEGCWMLKYHFFLWSWVSGINIALAFVWAAISGFLAYAIFFGSV